MQSKRIQWLDLLKGISIAGVVMGHSIYHIQSYNNYTDLLPLSYMIFVFIMPAFFAVSGYLYNFKRVNSLKSFEILLYKKVSSFLVPYTAFTFIIFIRKNLHNLSISNFFLNFFFAPSYIWFLYALFFIFIITSVMDLLHFNLSIQFLVYLILILIQLHFSWTLGTPTPCGVCSYGLFFWIGEITNKYSDELHKIFSICSIIFVITFGALLWYLLSSYKTEFDINNISLVSIIPKLFSVPFVFTMCQIISKHKNTITSYFTRIGKYTLIIYLVHFYIIGISSRIAMPVIHMPIINIALVFGITWIASVIICKIIERVKVLNFIFYTRKYINIWIKGTKLGNLLNIK